ncbi:hypothetical protein [Comamonas odontotermitis]|uniref:hypothetical protein n=1 Tax=Comamonas odontotermitis TaxID=379895 RepID=UPI001CC3F83B|nr:hypothetical protein [Comamonas odontotermitis]UBB18319.1 hypothetical protein LAD35_06690 [Comamonas odontotermitis]
MAVHDQREAFALEIRKHCPHASLECHDGQYASPWVQAAWTGFSLHAAIAATPALPATEGSSAGDLAEPDVRDVEIVGLTASIGHLSSLIDWQQAALMRAKDAMSALHSAAEPINESQGDLDARIPESAFAQFVDEHAALMYAIANSPVTPPQTEVQAEPVAWRYKRHGDSFGDFWFKPAGQSADDLRIGREDGVVLAPCPDHFDWTPLYTAPQAQPADALDAAPAAPAADALLEALESMVDVCESLDFDGAPSDASMIKARAAIAAYRATPAAANAKPADALLLHALELACDHIDMDSLRISHCKDAAAIDAAMAAAQEGGNAAKGM